MTIRTTFSSPTRWVAALAAGSLVSLAAPAVAGAALNPPSASPFLAPAPAPILVSTDPFTNPTSQHATEVEPDTFANGMTVVGAFQVGRFFDGGSTDIGFARSTDGGSTWSHGLLPGLTATSGIGGPTGARFERVSDPSVAYDARHAVWLVSSIPITSGLIVPYVFVNRSTTGGATWTNPVIVPPPAVPASSDNLDKNWTACDNTPTSRFYGHCYTEFDNPGENDLEYMSTSTDGGATWSTPVSPAGGPLGLGGQPLVQPNGTVIVPFENLDGTISAFRSTDGGLTFGPSTPVAAIAYHNVAGNLRTSPLPSAEIDGTGRVFVAWEDCRFRSGCSANDIVLSRSLDGVTWSAPTRIPLDPVTSRLDHFIPGLAVNRATEGGATHVALTYYYYPNAACTTATCQLDVAYSSSPDAGLHWYPPTMLAGPMSLSDIANTSQGPMVGDYISTSFTSAGKTTALFAVGKPHTGAFNEAMHAPAAPLPGATANSASAPAGAGVAVSSAPGAIARGRPAPAR